MLVAIVLGLLIVTSATAAPVAAHFLIVPGTSVGPLQIGMTRQQATQRMMAVFNVRARPDPVSEGLCWFAGNLCATFLFGKDTLVTATVKKDARFKTEEGVRVGSEAHEAVARLGERLGEPAVINTSDGAFVSWRGLQITVLRLGSGKFVVSSLMVSPKR